MIASGGGEWDGIGWLERLTDGWHRPWRIDPRGQDLALSPELWDRAEITSGVRGRWQVAGVGTWRLAIRVRGTGARVDILVGDELVRRYAWDEGEHLASVPVAGAVVIDMWLPNNGRVDVGTAHFTGEGGLTPAPVSGPRWIAYGSSITQASGADGPSLTWPSLVARRLGWRLHSYGVGGQCHLDPIVATQIATEPADVISLCLGINIYGHNSFSPRSLGPQVEGFVERVRAGHPGTPITMVTPIASPSRETTPNAVSFTLQQIRSTIAAVGQSLIGRGDGLLTVIDGSALLTDKEMSSTHSEDGVHPNTAGYARMADQLVPALSALLP